MFVCALTCASVPFHAFQMECTPKLHWHLSSLKSSKCPSLCMNEKYRKKRWNLFKICWKFKPSMSNCMNEKWRPTLLSGSKSSTFCRRRMNQKYRKAGKTFLRLKVQSLNFKPSMMSNCMNEKWMMPTLSKPCPSFPIWVTAPGRQWPPHSIWLTFVLFSPNTANLTSSLPEPSLSTALHRRTPLASRFDGREAFCSCTVCSCAQAGGLTQTDKLNRSELLRASLHHCWTSRSQFPKPLLQLLVQL